MREEEEAEADFKSKGARCLHSPPRRRPASVRSVYSHFWAPLNRALSLGVSPTSMILAPANNCMIKPDVTIGEMPSSMRVPAEERRKAMFTFIPEATLVNPSSVQNCMYQNKPFNSNE